MNGNDCRVMELWQEYLGARDHEARNLLVEHYAPLVKVQAARLCRRLPAQVTYDELCSAGFDGLIEAVEAYSPDHNTKFETFCQQRVVGAMMDWLRSRDPQSRTIRTFEKRRAQACERLSNQLNRPPTEQEIAQAVGLPLRQYQRLATVSRMGHHVHLSTLQRSSARAAQQGQAPRTWDIADPRQPDPCEMLARQMLRQALTRGLSRDERLVLLLYYCEDLTMAEIGAALNLSESRVSQIHKKLLQQLREQQRGRLEQELLTA